MTFSLLSQQCESAGSSYRLDSKSPHLAGGFPYKRTLRWSTPAFAGGDPGGIGSSPCSRCNLSHVLKKMETIEG